MRKRNCAAIQKSSRLTHKKIIHIMEATITQANGKTQITLNGRLDTENSIEFSPKIDALDDSQLTLVDIDCANLEYISSSGLRILISLLKKAGKAGGTVKLHHLNDSVKNVLDMTGFSTFFTID